MTLPALDDRVVSVNLITSVMPDRMEVQVNECHYASAYRMAGDEAMERVQVIHAVAMEALAGHWTIGEMQVALARERISRECAVESDAGGR